MVQFIWLGICLTIFLGIIISLLTYHYGIANNLSIAGFLMTFLLVVFKYLSNEKS